MEVRRAVPVCKNCQKEKKRLKHRGLCWSCYHNPDVRYLYPPCNKKGPYGRGGRKNDEIPDFNGGYSYDQEPCPYPPGSKEKVAWLHKRVLARVRTDHPLDGLFS